MAVLNGDAAAIASQDEVVTSDGTILSYSVGSLVVNGSGWGVSL